MNETSSPYFHGELISWAAWLYYGEGRTQSEVAERLGVSRPSVGNYLAEARRLGLVTISLDPHLLKRVELSKQLMARFSIESAQVIPSSTKDDGRTGRDRLGGAGAALLRSLLKPNQVLGVAWGRTMLSLARALDQQVIPGLKVAQIAGSSLGGEDISPEFCTSLIAQRLGARCVNFLAPAVVSSPAFRDLILAEPVLRKHFELIDRCDHVIFGVGRLEQESMFADAHAIPQPVIAEYVKNGAICAAVGRFLSADGTEVSGPLSGRFLSIEHTVLKRIPTRICVAGGPEKADPIKAMLTAGYVTHLVTDSDTAQEILEG